MLIASGSVRVLCRAKGAFPDGRAWWAWLTAVALACAARSPELLAGEPRQGGAEGPKAAAPEPPAASRLLPERTLGLLVAENLGASVEGFKKTGLYKLWSEPEVKAFLDPVLLKLADMLKAAEQEGEFSFGDVTSAFRGQVALAFVGVAVPAEGEQAEPVPEFALLAEVADRAAAARLLARASRAVKEAGGPELQTWELGPFTFGRMVAEKAANVELGYVLTDNALYAAVCPGGKLLQEIASTALGVPKWKPLAEDADFLKAISRAGARRDCFGYLSLRRLVDLVLDVVRREGGRRAAELARQVLGALGLDAVRSISFTDAVDEPGFRSELFVYAPAPRGGLFELFSEKPVRNELLRLAPADTRGMVVWRLRPQVAIELLRKVAAIAAPERAGAVDGALQFVKQSANIDIERDILNGLGLEGAIFGMPAKLAGLGPLGDLAGVALVMRLADPAAFRRAYDVLIELATAGAAAQGMQLQERLSAGGTPIKYVSAPMGLTPAVALGKSHLVLSPSADVVVDVLGILEGGQQSPAAATVEYQKALARAGVAPGFLVAYARPNRPEDIAQALAMLPMAAPFIHRAASDRDTPPQVRDLLRAIDLTKLPSAETLTRHDCPQVAIGWTDADGVGLTCWGPIGISGGSVLVGGAAAGAALPALATARERAARTSCMSNLKQVGVALHLYASDNGEKFPTKLQDLVPKYMPDATIMSCPAGKRQYAYVSGLKATDAPNLIIAFDVPGNHSQGANVLFVDGHVEWRGNAQAVLRQAEGLVRRMGAQGRKLEIIQPAGGAASPAPPGGGVEELF